MQKSVYFYGIAISGNLSTCKTRFNNVINFRAEPFIPGNDLMVSYPGKQDCATITENQAGNVLNLRLC